MSKAQELKKKIAKETLKKHLEFAEAKGRGDKESIASGLTIEEACENIKKGFEKLKEDWCSIDYNVNFWWEVEDNQSEESSMVSEVPFCEPDQEYQENKKLENLRKSIKSRQNYITRNIRANSDKIQKLTAESAVWNEELEHIELLLNELEKWL